MKWHEHYRGEWVKCVHCGRQFRYIVWNGPGEPPKVCMGCERPSEREARKIARGEK